MSHDLIQQAIETVVEPFDRVNPRSFINLLPPNFQDYILRAQEKRPDLFGLEERDLEMILRKEGAGRGPSGTENALRMRFWTEYDVAQEENRPMKMLNIIAGITEQIVFYKLLMRPEKVAWIVNRPASYETSTEEMHLLALSRLRKILDQVPVDAKGKFDIKIAEAQMKIFQILDTRVKGAVVQKSMQITANVSGKKAAGLLPHNPQDKKKELERKLAELERLADQNSGKIIDARTVDTE